MEKTQEDEGREGRRKPVFRSFLMADKAPMWFTTFVLLFGATGTYFIAPLVNAEFEAQKIKTDFVIRNYYDLRAKLEDFQGIYAAATQKQAGGDSIQADVLRLQEIVARTSAQNLAMIPMFTTANGPKAVGEVTAAMNGMIAVLFANAGREFETEEDIAAYSLQVEGAMQALVPPLLELYVQIGLVGRLRPTDIRTDLSLQ